MRKEIILHKREFGRLTALEKLPSYKNASWWRCLCLCGKTKDVRASDLIHEKVSSCGCLRLDRLRKAIKTHGLSRTRIWNIWVNMMQRCFNKKNNEYHNYGGRGITVCERWKTFQNFFNDVGHPKEGLTLDRIDNDENYEPSNVRWATRGEQLLNTRRNHLVSYLGAMVPLMQVSRLTGINYRTLQGRLHRGFTIDGAISKPILRRHK